MHHCESNVSGGSGMVFFFKRTKVALGFLYHILPQGQQHEETVKRDPVLLAGPFPPFSPF